jgi:hypothetical protein
LRPARGELREDRAERALGLRFYVRYAAWHLLDHTWEIEDRVM